MIHTPPLSDRELLAAFVKSGDGPAFGALAERHLGFVLGVACRRSGSREMAQEAAQNTLCQLARRAPSLLPAMREGVSLAPWLHAVSLREAGTLVRAEAARQRALRRLADFTAPAQSSFSPSSSLSSPPPGSEHLDAALAALPEGARRVLILRYLQGMSLREVAIGESISEEAARKRVARALDRLTRLLARRGVTAAGVTACLAAAPLLWPAPSTAAALAARALKQAAAPVGGAGLSGFAGFISGGHWLAAVVFLLTAAATALWPWGFPPVPVGATGVSDPASNPEALPVMDGIRRNTSPAVAFLWEETAKLNTKSWQWTQVDFNMRNYQAHVWIRRLGSDSVRLAALRRAVLDLSIEEARLAGSLPLSGGGWQIAEALYARWEELQPGEGLRAAAALGNDMALAGALRVRAGVDPADALRWIRLHAPGSARRHLLDVLEERIAVSNPIAYLRLMESGTLPDPEMDPGAAPWIPLSNTLAPGCAGALETLRRMESAGHLPTGSFSLVEPVIFGDVARQHTAMMMAFAADLPVESGLRRECLRAASLGCAATDPARATRLLAGAWTEEEEPHWKYAMTSLLTDWMAVDAPAVSRWLSEQEETESGAFADLARSAGIPLTETSNAVNPP